ncbi:TPA: acetylglutamate kinase, partial [Neisseria gonorrhoeae]
MEFENIISAADKARILAEALPYIRRFSGSVAVIKYGGNAMTEPALKEGFARDVVLLKLVGIHPVIVHGGGPQINAMLEKVGKKGEFVQGMRVTDKETMDIVEMVLGGHVNKEIVSMINTYGGHAVGVSGRDDHFIKAKKLLVDTPEQNSVDIGQVGTVESIDTGLVKGLIER